MCKYSVDRLFSDGVIRKKTLHEFLSEVKLDDPIIEIISMRNGPVWSGHAVSALFDLTKDYTMQCVQRLDCDEYGISIIVR